MTEQDDKKQFKNDGFGHTSWVIPDRKFDFQAHNWEQHGTELQCTSCQPHHASHIPVGKVLIKEEGEFKIIDAPVLS